MMSPVTWKGLNSSSYWHFPFNEGLIQSIKYTRDKGLGIRKIASKLSEGSGNSIIETNDGWYIAAEHYSGVYLYEGDIVYGNMKTYGFETITREDGEEGNFFIEDYLSSIGEAYGELCD